MDYELDLETLVTKNEYGHILQLEDKFLDMKLSVLEILDSYNDLKERMGIDDGDLSKIILEKAITMNELDCVNRNIDIIKMALQIKEKRTMELLETGTYFKN